MPFVQQKIQKINANNLRINIMVRKLVTFTAKNHFGDLRFCAGVAEYSVLAYDASSLGKALPDDKVPYGGRPESLKITVPIFNLCIPHPALFQMNSLIVKGSIFMFLKRMHVG
jgi:hypothetical protein